MIQNSAAGFFIVAVVILSFVAILGVWDFFSSDVITKSFETLGLLAMVALVVMVASKFVGDPTDPTTIVVANPLFRAMRNITLGTLIVSSAFLALLGVMAIWDVITDHQVLAKSLSSLAILAFASLVIVITCLDREGSEFWEKRGKEISGGAIFVAIILVWIMAAFLWH